MIASGLKAGFSASSWGMTSRMNCRTSAGSRQPLPSLSQYEKMARAVVSAIWHYDDFLLFCINQLYHNRTALASPDWIGQTVIIVMSKSVRSYGSSSGRGKESQESAQKIKERIKEILYSIKDERQHIENRLYENDVEIGRLRKDYELLRYEHDFEHLNEEEAVLVEELREGLRENNIDPQVVMGGGRAETQECRELSKQEVIEVQQIMISQLKQLLKQ